MVEKKNTDIKNIYVVLPNGKGFRSDQLEKHGGIIPPGTTIVVPPKILAFSFFLAALPMIDKPTRREEELGEFLLSFCLMMFIVYEYRKRKSALQ